MSKFKKKANTKQDIPTSALPDIIFMLLFFFMVTTVLRENTIIVEQHIPQASELTKLEKKTLVKHLYVGEPKKTEIWGSEPKIQADDAFIDTKDVVLWVTRQKATMKEHERDMIVVDMKVDENAKRGIISDIELQLRKANARKLLYTTRQRVSEDM